MFIPSPLALPVILGGVDPDVVALIERFSVPPSDARLGLISSTILAFKANALWDKLDAIWFIAAADAQAASLNWKSSNYTLVAVNSPTFTADRGLQGNGTTSYMDTQFNPVTAAGLFSQDSASLGVWVNNGSAASTSVIDLGNTSGSNGSLIRAHNTANVNLAVRVNAAATANFGANIATSLGSTIASRITSGQQNAYRNGAPLGPLASTSSPLPNNAVYLGAFNNNGSVQNFSSRRYACAFIGAGLNDDDVSKMFAITQEYLNAVGGA